jgi:hypothetical protein
MFYYGHFKYLFPSSASEVARMVHRLNLEDTDWAREHGISDDELAARKIQNDARVRGWARAMVGSGVWIDELHPAYRTPAVSEGRKG